MENKTLHDLPPAAKWGLSAYLILAAIGFTFAALMSHQHYDFSHEKTVTYYLGNETEMAFPKLYAQLLQTAHVHSFTMPVVFLPLWLLLSLLKGKSAFKKICIAGGFASILLYNAAPFLLRYYTPQAAWLFTVGGIGLFLSFLFPAAFVLKETWLGPACKNAK